MDKLSKFKLAVYKFITNDGIYITVLTLLVVAAWRWSGKAQAIIDWSFFSSIVFVVFIQAFSNMLKNKMMNKLEDTVKLTADYENLAARYPKTMLTFDNSDKKNKERLKKLLNAEGCVTFPVTCDYKLNGCSIKIHDSKRMYALPELVQKNYDELFAAHNTSSIYNQLNIRVDNWEMEDGVLNLYTSRTTYFCSMVTNRVMDYKLANGTCLRDYFGYGPFLPSLKESLLSNHLGFNGFVESSDGFIPFVKRRADVSVAKNTYGNSVSASLKTKYVLDDKGEFSLPLLLAAIKKEIKDELKIGDEHIESFSSENHHLIAAYRDVVEGGKPQLLFYVKSDMKKAEIEKNFKEKPDGHKGEMLSDGNELLWVSKDELAELCIAPGGIVLKNKLYTMVPNSSACIVMLTEYLKEIKEL